MSVPCIVITRIVQPGIGQIAWWTRPFIALDALAFYLSKLFWPASLGIDYGRSPSYVMQHGDLRWTWILPAGIAGALWVTRRRSRGFIAGAAICVAALLPVLGFIPFDFQYYSTVADHYLYLPMLGVAVCAAWLLTQLQCRFSANADITSEHSRSSRLIPLFAILVLLVLSAKSRLQTQYWRDSHALFTHALAVNPSSFLACNNLAGAYFAAGDISSAERYALKSVNLEPDQLPSQLMLASVLARKGDLEDAERIYRAIYADNPRNAAIAGELAEVLAKQGRLGEAISLARQAIALEPNLVAAHVNLGSMLANAHDFPAAVAELQRALQLNPRYLQARLNLAAVFIAMGQRRQAIDQYHAALEIDPQSVAAMQGLESLSAEP